MSLVLRSLGRLDVLAGCTRYCLEAVPELRSRGLPVLIDSWSSDTSEIVALAPDLVIASVPYRLESLAAILKAGLPVLALAPHSLADIYNDIRLIAAVVGEQARAAAVIAGMHGAVAEVTRISSQVAHQPVVYCEEWGKPMIHSQPWVKELVEAAGGIFLGTPGQVTTADEIAALDPDVITLAWCGAGDRVPVARVVAMRRWQKLRAFTTGRTVCISDELLNTPAPTLVDGLRALAAAIHPELFPQPPSGSAECWRSLPHDFRARQPE